MTSIKQNENLARELERTLADEIELNIKEKPTFPNDIHANYDFSTSLALYEVKSCHVTIKDGFSKQKKQSTRNGRFFIHGDSHKQLKEMTDILNKKAWYIFILLDNDDKIIKRKWFDWWDVQLILQRCKRRKIGDFMVDHKLVFDDFAARPTL